jgi:hypothetical protein
MPSDLCASSVDVGEAQYLTDLMSLMNVLDVTVQRTAVNQLTEHVLRYVSILIMRVVCLLI